MALAEAVWRRWLEAQGGTADEDELEWAPVIREVTAPVSGTVEQLGAIAVATAALHLGAGRRTKADTIDHAVGVVCHRKRGHTVEAGDLLAEVHARDEASAAAAARAVLAAYELGDEAVPGARRAARDRQLAPQARGSAPRESSTRGTVRSVPELPEVETVRARLAPVLEGRRLVRVEITDPRLTRPYDPAEVARELEGERVLAVERRGKYLIVRFESGRALLIHLRMTGSLRTAPGGTLPDDPHRRAVARLDDGSDVAYRDVRRFGTWLLLEPPEVEDYIAARVGPEPLEPSFRAATSRQA